jgi:hypothetical protein
MTRGRVVDTLDAERHGRVTCVAIADDGFAWAAAGSGDGIKLYDPKMSWRETVCSDTSGDTSGLLLRCTAMAPLRGVSSGGCLAIATEDGTVAAFDVRDGGWMERKFTVQPPGSPRVTSLCAFAPVPLVPAVRLGAGAGGGGQPRARTWFSSLFG